MARGLASFDRACKLDGTTEQQQLLGKGCLAGIGMGYYREGAAPGDFLLQTAHINRGTGFREKSAILPENYRHIAHNLPEVL
jgi:hypothetical protein